MTCPEDRLVAFLTGGLSDEEAGEVDSHLLVCEACWRAVQEDRAGRLAAERLRESAPAGLADRVALGIALASHGEAQPSPGALARSADVRRRVWPGGRHVHRGDLAHRGYRHRRPAVVAASALAGALLAAGLSLGLGGGPPGDPPQLAAVMAMAVPGAGSAARGAGEQRSAAGESMSVAGQRITVRSVLVDRALTVVATSRRPFPMPDAARVIAGSSFHAWMATRGRLSAYCVNRGFGGESVLVVAALPVAELPQVAAHLHLI